MQRTLLTWAIGFCLMVIATLLWDRSRALALAVLGVGGALLVYLNSGSKQPNDQGGYEMDGLFAVPSSSADARAAELLPMVGSEDASHLVAPLRDLERPREERDEYGPEPSTDWWISASFEEPVRLGALQLPRTEASAAGGPTIFARAVDGCLGYAHAADVEGPFTEVRLAWPYQPRQGGAVTEAEIREWLRRGTAWLEALPGAGPVSAIDPAEVAARAQELSELKASSATDVLVALRAPAGERFAGRDLWDVMLCAGLRWGDMDLFHLENYEGEGDDFWFSVESTTAPGYFLPEEIAAGRCNVETLVFRFDAARVTHPAETLEVALSVAEYAQGRLGGELEFDAGAPTDRDGMRAHVTALAERLADAGFPPGSDSALRLF